MEETLDSTLSQLHGGDESLVDSVLAVMPHQRLNFGMGHLSDVINPKPQLENDVQDATPLDSRCSNGVFYSCTCINFLE